MVVVQLVDEGVLVAVGLPTCVAVGVLPGVVVFVGVNTVVGTPVLVGLAVAV